MPAATKYASNVFPDWREFSIYMKGKEHSLPPVYRNAWQFGHSFWRKYWRIVKKKPTEKSICVLGHPTKHRYETDDGKYDVLGRIISIVVTYRLRGDSPSRRPRYKYLYGAFGARMAKLDLKRNGNQGILSVGERKEIEKAIASVQDERFRKTLESDDDDGGNPFVDDFGEGPFDDDF